MSRVLLIKKTISYEKDGKKLSFPKIYGKVEKVVTNDFGQEELKVKWFEIGFKAETKEKLEVEMIKKDFAYPVSVEINDDNNDYFIIPQTYKNKDGEEVEKTPRIVILNYSNLEPAPKLEPNLENEENKKKKLNINDYFND